MGADISAQWYVRVREKKLINKQNVEDKNKAIYMAYILVVIPLTRIKVIIKKSEGKNMCIYLENN